MPVTLNVNDLSLVHKTSQGMAKATAPYVCKTLPTPFPVPCLNIAFSMTLTKGTVLVTADGYIADYVTEEYFCTLHPPLGGRP